MKELAIYLVEAVACSGVLLAAYALLLERRVAFRWCRLYLLLATVAAAVIPLLEIPVWPGRTATMTPAPLYAAEAPTVYLAEAVAAPSRAPEAIAWGIYLAGVIVLSGAMLRQIARIRRLRRGATIRRNGQFTLVRTPQPIASFSLFRSIYVYALTPPHELAAIVAHERSHIRHRHSVERLGMECLKAALWWNPFVWAAARRLNEAQEFEADRDALDGGIELAQYTSTLFSQLYGCVPDIASGLRDSLTKKRLQMMTTAKCSRHALLRLAGTLPAVAMLLCAFCFTSRAAAIRTPDAAQSIESPDPVPAPPAETGRVALRIAVRSEQGISLTDTGLANAKARAIGTGEETAPDERGVLRLEAAPGTVYEITYPGYEPVLYTVGKGEAALIIMMQPEGTDRKEPAVYVRDEYGVKQRPLYVVDGRERPNEPEGINATNIESIKMLKGEEAVARYGERARYGAFVVTTTGSRQPTNETGAATSPADEEDDVYLTAETMPRFRGGELNDFVKWISEQPVAPEDLHRSGRVMASFVVGTDGSVEDVRILASPGKSFSDEATRAIRSSSGMWTPGMHKGKAVKVRYTIPVRFATNEAAPAYPAQSDAADPAAKNEIPMLVEQMPSFAGEGIVGFRQWVLSQVRYPEAAMKKKARGKVLISFVVEKDGSVAPGTVLQTPDRLLSDEVLRVLTRSPRWEPGREKGGEVAVRMLLPVEFNIVDGTTPVAGTAGSAAPGTIPPVAVTAFE